MRLSNRETPEKEVEGDVDTSKDKELFEPAAKKYKFVEISQIDTIFREQVKFHIFENIKITFIFMIVNFPQGRYIQTWFSSELYNLLKRPRGTLFC